MKRLALRALGRLGLLAAAYRAYERASSLRVRPGRDVADDGLPVPPPALIVRVAGTPDVEWFLRGGRLAAESIRAALSRHGRRIEDVGALLDFGCGCGRVTRNWLTLPRTDVFGSDMNEDAVEWCRRSLPFATFVRNGLAPPLAFENERFDLVYALSVFTHLPEDLQAAWMRELQRVLRPGGLVLLSTHGEHYLPRLTAEERDRFAAGEVVVRWEEVAGTNLCTAFHPPSYVRDRLAAGLEVLEFVAEGAKGNPHQDLFVLRRPS
ncbi:MAG: class I SAM-dependent methyltransferase [Actinomycetota bacterium]|nr:class I SAM-dependent methyltransferase [Actinomycetota bacterium]